MNIEPLIKFTSDFDCNCINTIYKFTEKINEGAFGYIYKGLNLVNKTEIAIKIEKKTYKAKNSLAREAKLLRSLQNITGIPEIFWYGHDKSKDVKALVIQFLGKSLEERVRKQGVFSLKTILLLAEQLIEILKNIHGRGVIHRDIKPENILLGHGKAYKTVYLIDFGISKRYFKQTGEHITLVNNKPFIGTLRFASESAHKGLELSRKDDLESLGYAMIFMMKGKLPWMNKGFKLEEKKAKIGELKGKISLDELCRELPSIFQLFFKYTRSLGFYEVPNYDYLKNLFCTLKKCMNFRLDTRCWDWKNKVRSNDNSLSFDGSRVLSIHLGLNRPKPLYGPEEYDPTITERPEIWSKMKILNNSPKDCLNRKNKESKTCCSRLNAFSSYMDSRTIISNTKTILSEISLTEIFPLEKNGEIKKKRDENENGGFWNLNEFICNFF